MRIFLLLLALALNATWLLFLIEGLLGFAWGGVHIPWLHRLFLVVIWSAPLVNIAALLWFFRSLAKR